MDAPEWRGRQDFQVMRLLVGDCKLSHQDALAITQKVPLELPVTALQRELSLRQWQVLSTDAKLSGDIMFVLGGFAEERTVPLGRSFKSAACCSISTTRSGRS